MPVTTPLSSTIAIVASLLLQVTDLLLASVGSTLAIRVYVSVVFSVTDVLSRLTPVTGWRTVTAQVAVKSPSTVVTVIVAVPAFIPVTTPFSSTVAIAASLLLQVTDLLLASTGSTLAISEYVSVVFSVTDVLSRLIPVTGWRTVTAQVAAKSPSTVVTVIVAVPAFMPVTTPFSSTVARAVSLLFQVTDLLLASIGSTLATSVYVSVVFSVTDVLSRLIPVTGCVAVNWNKRLNVPCCSPSNNNDSATINSRPVAWL